VAEHTPSLSGAYPDLEFSPAGIDGLDGLDLVFSALPTASPSSSSPTSTGASVRSSTWPPTSG